MEFTILSTFMILVFIVFFLLIQGKMVDIQDQRNLEQIRHLGEIIDNEVKMAESTQSGYSRVFSLPTSLGKDPYSLTFSHGEVILVYREITYPLFLSVNVTNYSIGIGSNRISHYGNNITLVNSSAVCGDGIIQQPNYDLEFEECDPGPPLAGCGTCTADCEC